MNIYSILKQLNDSLETDRDDRKLIRSIIFLIKECIKEGYDHERISETIVPKENGTSKFNLLELRGEIGEDCLGHLDGDPVYPAEDW